ncbi:MAG TPA: glycosyltransferase family 61 protein, partial [Opitutaceae bacterium]|nr:glycosyltransferase family 61 protein [Opitutaceae bacterium]
WGSVIERGGGTGSSVDSCSAQSGPDFLHRCLIGSGLTTLEEVTFLGYVPPPDACEPLAEMVARWGGSFRRVGEVGQREEISLPRSTYGKGVPWWAQHASWRSPDRFLAALPQGRIFGAGNVLAPDGTTLAGDVSPDRGKLASDHWLLSYLKIRPPVSRAGVTAVASVPLAHGYSHWLLEELPRLLALRGQRFDHLVAHATETFQRVALDHLGWTSRVRPGPRYAHVACEQLLIPDVPSWETPSRTTLAEIAEFGRSVEGDGPHGFERLYLSRSGARRRRVVKEALLWEALAPMGFQQVFTETLTLSEQSALFRRARLVVAPHGAGLANLVFSPPGTRVIELLHSRYLHPGYWRIAALLGHDYRAVVEDSGGGAAYDPSANRLDIDVSIDEVLKAVKGEG